MTEIKNPPFNSLQVMTYIIQFCRKNQISLNVTKLQKLMYCCYGVVLAKTGVRLTDEYPEAWKYGPVFPDALKCVQFLDLGAFEHSDVLDIEDNQKIKCLMDATITHFGKYSALKLSNWTHLPDSPWYKASDGGQNLFIKLRDEDVKDYFTSKVLA